MTTSSFKIFFSSTIWSILIVFLFYFVSKYSNSEKNDMLFFEICIMISTPIVLILSLVILMWHIFGNINLTLLIFVFCFSFILLITLLLYYTNGVSNVYFIQLFTNIFVVLLSGSIIFLKNKTKKN